MSQSSLPFDPAAVTKSSFKRQNGQDYFVVTYQTETGPVTEWLSPSPENLNLLGREAAYLEFLQNQHQAQGIDKGQSADERTQLLTHILEGEQRSPSKGHSLSSK